MHLPGLLEHRLRKFLLITLWLRKELGQEEALRLEVSHLHPSPAPLLPEKRKVVFQHLGKTWITNKSLKVIGELVYSAFCIQWVWALPCTLKHLVKNGLTTRNALTEDN